MFIKEHETATKLDTTDTTASTYNSSPAPEKQPVKEKRFKLKKVKDQKKDVLYSNNWPPISRENIWRRRLYLLSFIIKLLLSIQSMVCVVLLNIQNRTSLHDAFATSTMCSGILISLLLVGGGMTDFHVWKYAPQWLQEEWPRTDFYCIYGAQHFESACSKVHRIGAVVNRLVSTLSRAVAVAFAVPGSQWRWSSCENKVEGDDLVLGHCVEKTMRGLQLWVFLSCVFGAFTPFITEVLWQSKVWTLYSLVGALRLSIGTASTAIAMRYIDGIWRFQTGRDEDYNLLLPRMKDQVAFLFYMLLVNGLLSGTSHALGGLYSQFCVWKRSRYHLLCDMMINTVTYALQVTALIGSRMVFTVQSFFCDYNKTYPEENLTILDDICMSINTRYGQSYLSATLQFGMWLCLFQLLLGGLMQTKSQSSKK
eukprot:Blabericola_migrator_1__12959@NODE_858_length_6240_cov_61_647821_g608_i0_p1_GENE_NODE_858_length_6240_cov_61_647821_g608_i0NODE_858_length_6240_cov_61_647821_g608_i0_p1_ORF_typecomplete_len424_score61_81DUF4577/PF15145_6/0_12_NODE_858_length_6240_cov_61_647821_g608_i026643935